MKSNTSSLHINKRGLMLAAWATFRKRAARTFGEALRLAWRAMKLQAAMRLGTVKFTFRKLNGELRDATGTLAAALLPTSQNAGYAEKKHCAYNIAFFDLDKQAFRSFNVWTLL